jgi:hypothetical protein
LGLALAEKSLKALPWSWGRPMDAVEKAIPSSNWHREELALSVSMRYKN